MSNRRSFINLSEAVRALDVPVDAKKAVVDGVAQALATQPDFNAARFTVHALSDVAHTPVWNEDAQEWTYTNDDGNTVVLKRGNGIEVREAVDA